jgi:anthranilate synthase component 1
MSVPARIANAEPDTWALPTATDLRALQRLNAERYPFLLQSTARSDSLGRFDILFAFPGATLVLEDLGRLSGELAGEATGFLTRLDQLWQEERLPSNASGLPFTGGWFLYLGYELAAEIEPGLTMRSDPLLPTAFAVRCRAAIIVDHHQQTCLFVSEAGAGIDPEEVQRDIESCVAIEAVGSTLAASARVEEDPPGQFRDAVAQAQRYIELGDIYQANLSRRWSANYMQTPSPATVYAALCHANPAPFAGLAHWHDTTIVSSSPERLLRVRDGEASTRPIAGTRPRSKDREIDTSLTAELIAHPKERAEHIMLIDLERNDLGRICRPGTVEVNEMMVIESYAHVHHIVSNVRGVLRQDATPGDCIRAVFPGGTITGCPKVRCMEIITELERDARGAYTGAIGYLNRDGSLDLNILIRTLVMRGNELTFRAGAGIVADSEPEAELEETRAKAKGLLFAVQP